MASRVLLWPGLVGGGGLNPDEVDPGVSTELPYLELMLPLSVVQTSNRHAEAVSNW